MRSASCGQEEGQLCGLVTHRGEHVKTRCIVASPGELTHEAKACLGHTRCLSGRWPAPVVRTAGASRPC